MTVETTPLHGLLVLVPRIFSDDRGWFFESFNARGFMERTGVEPHFVQDNESRSAANVLRGLHIQAEPHSQGKLVRVVCGAVLDVCVDVRPGSPTFGRHFAMRLDGREKKMLWIPEGFAHGFLSLEEGTVFNYKCTRFFNPASERTILWNDPALGIAWGVDAPMVSDKDRKGIPLQEYAATVHA
ncbi:MAG: dTDP-4-dehydrorhamnose 3,5-epimerase [Flavobacteriales bacterium]|nr:MAG: dTDP-4-dehydrorhamnose 3,5-epimerase [Flavobacteriales bacterium]